MKQILNKYHRERLISINVDRDGVVATCAAHGMFKTSLFKLDRVEGCPQCPPEYRYPRDVGRAKFGRPSYVDGTFVVAVTPLHVICGVTSLEMDVWQVKMQKILREPVFPSYQRKFTAPGAAKALLAACRAMCENGTDLISLDNYHAVVLMADSTPDVPPAKRPVGRPAGIKKAPVGA